MPYLDTHARTTAPTSNEKFQPIGRITALFGVFVGFVKDTTDVQRNGRLRVWIPEMGSAPDNVDGWIVVNYCAPFAGATNVDTISKSSLDSFEGTQTSYGFWMVPPDINNQVLIMFINGDSSRGIWIGSMYSQYMNNMIPGMATNTKNSQYPGKHIPVAEYNKWDTKITRPEQATHPFEKTKFKGVGNQGLIVDQGRGVTSSSARREAPSNVFGILTPGPAIDPTVAPQNIRRKGGSSFIMDDGTGTEYVELATKTGAKVRIDETNGFIYLINRDGTAWVQMDQKGNIDIFGATNISMRAQKDINLRADRNINIEAGQNIFMKAAKDTVESSTSFTYDVNNVPKPATIPLWKYVGEGNGQGGNIVFQSAHDIHTTVKNNLYLTIDNNLEIKVKGNVDISADTEFNVTSPSIKHVGAVKTRGTLDVTGAVGFGNTLAVNSSVNAASGSFSGAVHGGDSEFISVKALITNIPGTPGTAGGAVNVAIPSDVILAEVKAPIEKVNILATWVDPESKFKRNAAPLQTIVSTFPTYEPCPEHETFTFPSIAGYTPTESPGSRTYEGSGAGGHEVKVSPPPNTDPGANNKKLPPTPAAESVVTKDFNMAAYQYQLTIHEGVRYVSYLDTVNKPTGGIGHLLRTNEIPIYPVPTPISAQQVSTWFEADALFSIAGAQRLLGTDTWGVLSDVRKRACADLYYNLGENRLGKFRRFIAAMKKEDFSAAGESLRDSKWFKQVGRRGPNIVTMITQNVDVLGADKKYPLG